MGKIVEIYPLIALLSSLFSSLLSTLPTTDANVCRGRHILNSTYGHIIDAPKIYEASSFCEWLISAGKNGKYITLTFSAFHTECSYDYLFVYDGNSYKSPLLGSFSGRSVPDRVTAYSGQMLVFFYSDTNYKLNGFDAVYSVTHCLYNCSGHGTCRNNQCFCYSGFSGLGCEVEQCPDSCSQNGFCDIFSRRCICNKGFSGPDCNFITNSTLAQNTWYELTKSGRGYTVRAGHGSVFLSGRIWTFGGTTLNRLLNDLVQFDFEKNAWQTVYPLRTSSNPAARYKHAVTAVDTRIFVFGGILANGSFSNELWAYNTIRGTWNLEASNSSVYPPGLASHTLTAVNDTWLYVIGGRTEKDPLTSGIYRYPVSGGGQWEKMAPRGGRTEDRRLVGHSAVYHPESKSILVFGGYMPNYAKFHKRTSDLHAYHVEQNYWSQIHYKTDVTTAPHDHVIPRSRAYHTATIVGNYMLVFGGTSHQHNRENDSKCFDDRVYAFHLGCNQWVDLRKLSPSTSASSIQVKGRFSHSAVTGFRNKLYIIGGYRGSVLGDLMVYTVPRAVAHSQDEGTLSAAAHCAVYDSRLACMTDPECGWCLNSSTSHTAACLHRTAKQTCTSDWMPGKCHGICSALMDCGSCVAQGQGSVPGSLPGYYHNVACHWCVKTASCQQRTDPRGVCLSAAETASGMKGWWGGLSGRLTTLSQCQKDDHPAGLHWIRYRYPANYQQPDEVSIINVARQTYTFEAWAEREALGGGVYMAMFKGYVYPLGAPPAEESSLKLYLISITAQAVLLMSTDDQPANKEIVAKLSGSDSHVEAKRSDGRRIFPDERRGRKYYLELRSTQRHAYDGSLSQVQSSMILEWNGAIDIPTRRRHELTSEFLEPFSSGHCDGYTNCMACMTDISCGWCRASGVCHLRNASSTACPAIEHATSPWLIITPADCPTCRDYISCHTCAADKLCEWLVDEARCMRRGQFALAVNDTGRCPPPCEVHGDCASCLKEQNECAWCEQTQTCFPFGDYLMRFSFGQCTSWVDSTMRDKCQNCSAHATCKSCLATYSCGWCSSVENPTIGRCVDGDYVGPEEGVTCPAAMSSLVSTAVQWSYGVCPDVAECKLNLDNCHENATCTNTFESFTCTCKRGFVGDGVEKCDKTCYYNCVHGVCSGAPDFKCLCSIGWTGEDCNTECGCYNHSTCVSGVGKCDACQNWTTGDHCELCKPGSYGNATTTLGCKPCDCNSHANPSLGLCSRITGECYCQHDTEGAHCERCKAGYYGNPRNGGQCFMQCDGRNIIGNLTEGGLGSAVGSGVENKQHVSCLWILTIHPDLNTIQMYHMTPTITFTILPDLDVQCTKNYVYVYDGIPGFMTREAGSRALLLGAFCGRNLKRANTVIAKSGYLTVYFEADISIGSGTSGFNATYKVNSCVDVCSGHRICEKGQCECIDGYGGHDCQIELCPANCSDSQGHGHCDKKLKKCVCKPGYTGSDCSQAVSPRVGVYQALNDPWRQNTLAAFSSKLSRMGHTLVACDEDTLYMFGGYSLGRGALNDLWRYNIPTNEWAEVIETTSEKPGPRYYHACVCVPTLKVLLVYGGLTEKSGASNELWQFTLDNTRWSKVKPQNPVTVPALAGHSLSLISDTNVLVIGGFSSEHYYSDKVYEFDVNTKFWGVFSTTGSQPIGIYGHSAVYHHNSRSVYVFGGYEYQLDKNVASNNLYALHLITLSWHLLAPHVSNQPPHLYFHTAVSTDEYMVIVGGATRDGYTDYVAVYRYSCNRWIDLSSQKSYMLGDDLQPVAAAAAVVLHQNVYIMAGFNALSQPVLYKLTLPSDLCRVHSTPHSCLVAEGCTACVVTPGGGTGINITHCYSTEKKTSASCDLKVASQEISGSVCNADWIRSQRCELYRSCSECLSGWPVHGGIRPLCQWCRNCKTGKCVPKNADCKSENPCPRQQNVILDPNKCMSRMCLATDCDKCKALKTCIWTRHFWRSSEARRTLNLNPIYNWNCVAMALLDATRYVIESMPPSLCPRRCYEYRTCKTCLSAPGSEGGAQQCVWSQQLQECMPVAYLPLRCSNGECGFLLADGKVDQCPQKCSIHAQCSHCLAAQGCGWCAFGGLNGHGVCMDGGLTGPRNGLCSQENVTLVNEPLPERASLYKPLSTGIPSWAFSTCPAENECENNHHTCGDTENCRDLQNGYQCDCKEGYKRNNVGEKCQPVCHQGCNNHGDCILPDVCQCHLGWVGHNCSTQCQCNQHSNCKSVEEPNKCLKCQNNTQGAHCEFCRPLFIGDPTNGGTCKTCSEYCNQHSEVCLDVKDYNLTKRKPYLLLELPTVTDWVENGPVSSGICINCKNNTRGQQCQHCERGYFRLQKDPTQPCQKCNCNGHSDICDVDSGENCDCKNNTKSPRCDKHADEKIPCYQRQCSKCKDNYWGTPTGGHQCYRHISVNHDFCFDPYTQMNCNRKPPLLYGRTVYFGVQPKYLNVDIRITLDVTQGGLDVYLSPFDDTFIIDVNKTAGTHGVAIDSRYKVRYQPGGSTAMQRGKRDTGSNLNSNAIKNTTDARGSVFRMEERIASGLDTFVTVHHVHTILVIRNVQNRLVITLPHHRHELKSTKFYMVLIGRGQSLQNLTVGNLFFRQDQPHIDLFVFFSVFFSSFFLFLAFCVLLWKIKQAFDIRRSRHRRLVEMEHMASRPFGKALVFIDSDMPVLVSSPIMRKNRLPKLSSKYSFMLGQGGGGGGDGRGEVMNLEEEFHVHPLALEPSDDGIAAVGTVMFQLPGGSTAPSRVALGSALITTRVMYPSHNYMKNVYRRRTSSSMA